MSLFNLLQPTVVPKGMPAKDVVNMYKSEAYHKSPLLKPTVVPRGGQGGQHPMPAGMGGGAMPAGMGGGAMPTGRRGGAGGRMTKEYYEEQEKNLRNSPRWDAIKEKRDERKADALAAIEKFGKEYWKNPEYQKEKGLLGTGPANTGPAQPGGIGRGGGFRAPPSSPLSMEPPDRTMAGTVADASPAAPQGISSGDSSPAAPTAGDGGGYKEAGPLFGKLSDIFSAAGGGAGGLGTPKRPQGSKRLFANDYKADVHRPTKTTHPQLFR